ncbi:L-2-hydroxyglutarate oxidase [Acidimicrobiia bacterium]|nr:L-2-hydroxyglutarate oxidase [Candidatus Actinomarina sp.]MDA9844485.1 L-2-hydroxyglutarate oxidase [Acidimicrobiia bacterium]MDC0595727.1 L-2-hydroxyglutarate oxidase [Acidimicrobiia bacterium]MDC3241333.1 L-2-hydroxyglutarate oxidase [Acidimicrobiia bacterium]
MRSSKKYDYIVIGGGIVGLSTALKLQEANKKILILEKESGVGLHQSGRNSGVLHSGIYYKPDSFKSNLCLRGRELMLEFLESNNIPYRLEGKIVVDENIQKIESLFERSKLLAMSGVQVLEKDALIDKEPNSKILQGLFVPQAGVVDYKIVTEMMVDIFRNKGGDVEYFQEIVNITENNDSKLVSSKKETFTGDFLINCAGLFSDKVARLDGLNPKVKIIPFRGEYYEIINEKSHLLNNMIYPIADPELPFLGIHLTKTVDGRIEAGPNAVLAFSREGYSWTKFNLFETLETITYKGMVKLGRKYFKTGIDEMYRSLNKAAFVQEVKKLLPGIESEDLVQRPAGVRAQAVSDDGSLLDDFLFEEGYKSLHVLNAPSPAATASLAIGEYIASKVLN